MTTRTLAVALAACLAPLAGAQCRLSYNGHLLTSPAQGNVARSVSGDFDGDGKADLAYVFTSPGSGLSILWGLGDGFFSAPFEFDPAGGNAIDIGDFNEDGLPDLAVAVPPGPRAFKILTSNGDRTFTTHPFVSFGPGPGFTALEAKDIDGDGHLDVVGVTATSGQGVAGIHLAQGDGSGALALGPSTTFTPPTLQVAASVHAMRLDDQPGAEIVATTVRSNSTTVYTAPFVSWSQSPVIVDVRPVPIFHHTSVAADLDADGFDDLILGSNGPGGQGLTVLNGSGSGTLRPEQFILDNRGIPTEMVVADADGDGDPDVYTVNATFRVWINDGRGGLTSNFFSFTNAGFTGLSVADFNRDGRPDLAINGGTNVSVILNEGPLASAHPVSDAVLGCGGNSFEVAIDDPSDPSVRPRWEYLSRSGWAPIEEDGSFTTPDGALFGSAAHVDTAILKVTPVPGCCPASVHAVVRCVVRNDCGVTTGPSINLSVCRPDFNCDAFLDFFDYDDFIGAYLAGDASADFNGDGFLDFFDYDEFVAAYETGC